MAEAIPDVQTASSTVKVTETPEFKQALDDHRKNLKAEYERKHTEGLAARDAEWEAKTRTPTPSSDWFEQFETKYGVPRDAARELLAASVGIVQRDFVAPLASSAIRQELRAQKAELRANPKLAKLDDRYGKEVAEIIGKLNPSQVTAETYASALKLAVGNHVDELEEEWGKGEERDEPEIVRQPPRGSTPAPESKKVTLTETQKTRASDMGFSHEDYAELMVKRARKLEEHGLTKAQVRQKLGAALGNLDF